MSSLRNSVQRRSHRERAQPLERARLGLLEKKKDYQKRAKDYKKKQTVLKSLREKAAEKNEDEFYFGMMSRKSAGSSSLTAGKGFDGKVEGDRGNKAMDVDLVRLLKTQDLGYVRTVRNVVMKEVRGLEERWVLAGGGEGEEEGDSEEEWEGLGGGGGKKKAKKIVFCGGVEERKERLEGKKRQEREGEGEGGGSDDEERRRKEVNLEKLAKKLKEARKKLKALTDAELELEVTQAKMAKTATSGGVTKAGKRIKVRERKR
ncbi:putative U3 small nucleolar RNA-associated protein 11 [Cercophora samala]|uniref:U3 small nucleolar RNA-associated protein 11 n=1 Tax=Cercophora samala TaxID=330535 RepID=A0AA39Z7T4_9PEZI|nr:putative U3 small nucleolar RNA-associated protein 11 [Cercophora samala]